MQVRLVSKSVIEADYVSYLLNELQAEPEFQDIVSQPEGLMAYIARVSSPNPTNQSYAKLLKYCIDHKHWSVFESVNLVFELETSRAISAQILRHRSFCFQEFCLTGDSLISLIKPSGGSYRQSIAELYRLQSAPNYKGKTLRVYDELTQQFTTAPLKEVFYNGVKPVYKVTTSDGKVIKTTKEHKFLTQDGFKSLEDIVGLTVVNGKHAIAIKDATIGVNGAQVVPLWQNKEWLKEQRNRPTLVPRWVTITSVEYVGKEETYDLEVDHQSHNYVANRIVVHNSQRYQAVDDTGVEIYAARKQDTKNRQNSTDDLSDEIKQEWEARQLQNWKQSFEHYTWALDNNIAKECARMVLPLSTKTKIFMTGNVRNWIHYIELRTANGTQQEHKEIALAIKQIFVQQMPEISTALGWN